MTQSDAIINASNSFNLNLTRNVDSISVYYTLIFFRF